MSKTYYKIYKDASGSVGVGTTSPTKPLTIRSNSEQLLLETSSSPTTFYATLSSRYDSAHPFALSVANNSSTSIEYFGVYADGGGANNRVSFPSGSVGIGTTAPGTTKLRVVNGSSGQEIFKADDGATAVIRAKVDGTVSFEKGITLAGRASALNTGSKLQVDNAIALGSSLYTFSQVIGGADLQLISNANPANLGVNSNIIFKLGTSGGGGPVERMRIVSDGKIQIGNNIPMWSGAYGGALVLKGDNATSNRYAQLAIVDSTGSIVNNGLILSNSGDVGINYSPNNYANKATLSMNGVWGGKIEHLVSGTVKSDWEWSTGGLTVFGTKVSEALQFKTNNTGRVLIDPNGNVKIGSGAANASGKLEIVGNLIINGASNSNVAQQVFTRTDVSWGIFNETNLRIYSSNSNTTSPSTLRFQIASTGAIQFSAYGSGSFTGTSTHYLTVDSSGNVIKELISSGTPTGSGTVNYIPKWTGSVALGNSVIYETSAGDVLIGSSSGNSDKLEVWGDPNQFAARLNGSNTGSQSYGLRIRAGSTYVDKSLLVEDVYGSDIFIIQGDGNVGIGATSPSSTLHVVDGTSGASVLTVDGTNGTLFEVVDDLSGSLMSVNDAAGLPVLEVFADSHIVAGRYGQNDFYLDTNGNLGLGTGSPNQKLHIESSSDPGIILNKSASGGQAQIAFQSVGVTKTQITSNYGDNRMYVYHQGSNALVLDSSGHFGIGLTPTGNARLQVYNTNGDYNAVFSNSGQATVEIRGGESENARLRLIPDEGDDVTNADHFQIIHLASNNDFALQRFDGSNWDSDFVLDVNGNVGIGENIDPAQKLHITDGGILMTDENAGQPMFQARNFATSATGTFNNTYGFEYRHASSGTQIHGALIHLNENVNSRRALTVSSVFGTVAQFTSAGYVGIGTGIPEARMQVVTTSDTSGTPTSYDGKYFTVGQGGTTSGNVFISYDNTNHRGYIGALSPSVAWRNLILNPGGGNVGISIVNPGNYKLYVSGTGTDYNNSVIRTDSSSNQAYTYSLTGIASGGLSTGNRLINMLGTAFSPYNAAYWGFKNTGGTSSASNEITFGLFGYNDLIRISATNLQSLVNINPSADATYSIGTSSLRWYETYTAKLLAGDGSASAPGITFINDTNTGLYRPANDYLSFTTGGLSRMTIFSSGVQIDKDSPGMLYQPLENSSYGARFFLLFDYTNNASYPFLTNRTPSGKVVIKTGVAAGGGENTHFTIEGGNGTVDAYFENANLGIGTTGPRSALDVHEASDSTLRTSRYTSNGIKLIASDSNNSMIRLAFDAYLYDFRDGNNNPRLYIEAGSGNVGIGTASPAGKLDVRAGSGGEIIFGTYNANFVVKIQSGDQLNFYNGASATAGYINYDGGATVLSQNLHVEKATGGTTGLVRIKADGNVGVGTTSPTSKLNVYSSTAGASIFSADGTSGRVFEITDDISTSLMSVNTIAGLPAFEVFADYHIVAGRYNQNDFYLDTNGNLGLGTASPIYKLQVDNPSGSTYGASFRNTNDNLQLKIGTTTGGVLNIQGTVISTGAAYKIGLQADGGSVGIGTANPGYQLDVAGDIRISSSNVFRLFTSGGIERGSIQATDTDHLIIATSGGEHIRFKDGGVSGDTNMSIFGTGQIAFNNYGSGSFTGTATQRLAVDSSGNIIEIPIGAGAVDGLGAQNKVAYWTDTDTISYNTNFHYDTSSGSLGIGTPSPSQKLQVNGGHIYIGTSANKFLVSNGYSYFRDYSTYGGYLGRISIISMNNAANSWDDYAYHGIGSTDASGNFADSISINSYNDITLRLDSNNNNSASYFRIMNNTTGNNIISYIGFDGTYSTAQLPSFVGVNAGPSLSYNLYVNGSLGISGQNTYWLYAGDAYLRCDNEFRFLTTTGSAQRGRFKSIQVSTTYGGTPPDNGILFYNDTTLTRTAAYTLTANTSAFVIDSASGDGVLKIYGSASAYDGVIELLNESGASTEGFRIRYDNDVGDTYFDNIWSSGSNANPAIRFRTKTYSATVDAMTITHGGNVGIGTTSPDSKFQVGAGTSNSYSTVAQLSGDSGGASVLSALSLVNSRTAATGNGVAIDFHTANNYSPTARIATVTTGAGGVANADLRFYTYNGGLAQQMVLDRAGNLGIGTVSPTNGKLVVAGNGVVTGDLMVGRDATTTLYAAGQTTFSETSLCVDGGSDSVVGIRMTALRTSGASSYEIWADSTALHFDTMNNGRDFVFNSQGGSSDVANQVWIMNPNGEVGIGDSAPDAKLHVQTSGGSTTSENVVAIFQADTSSAILGGGGTAIKFRGVSSGGNIQNYDQAMISSYGYSSNNSHGLAFYTKPNAATALTMGLFISSNLNVGIGTTSPAQKLAVMGSIYMPAGQVLTWSNGDADIYSSGYSLIFRTYDGSSNSEKMRILGNGNVGIGTASPGYKLQVNGSFAATTKSFDIAHPTKEGKRLVYASLEGPENGVYVRGRQNTFIIELPDYWVGLVHEDSITVNLTSIGRDEEGNVRNYSVDDIKDNKVFVYTDSPDKIYNYFYTINGERKDVDKLEVEKEEV